MADNYLENKFEEYQARKNGKGKPRVIVKHEIVEVEKNQTVKIDRKLNIVIVGGTGDFGRKLVSAFSEDGHKVALLNSDAVLGRMTASKNNSIFINCNVCNTSELKESLTKLYDLWENIDVVINLVEKFEEATKGVITNITVKNSLVPIEISMRCLSELIAERNLKDNHTSIINIGWIYDEKMKESESFSSSVALGLAQSSFMYRDLRFQNLTVNSLFVEGDKMLPFDDKKAEKNKVESDALKLVSLLVNPENNFIQGETFSL